MIIWLIKFLAALLAVAIASAGILADDNVARRPAELRSQDILSATPLLTEQEQTEYRARIRAAASGSERERIRTAHYDLMKARARERGHKLPEIRPPAVGEAGSSFGPQGVDEEALAAQRARSRKAASPMAAPVLGTITQESGIVPAAPPANEQPALSSRRPGDAKHADAVKLTPPVVPGDKPAASAMGAIVLPRVESIFGPQLMSEEERAAFRTRLRSAKSEAERQAIQAERDTKMRLRAKAIGATPQ